MRHRGGASCTGTQTGCPRIALGFPLGEILTKEAREWCLKGPIQKEDSEDYVEGTELMSPFLVNGEKIFESSYQT